MGGNFDSIPVMSFRTVDHLLEGDTGMGDHTASNIISKVECCLRQHPSTPARGQLSTIHHRCLGIIGNMSPAKRFWTMENCYQQNPVIAIFFTFDAFNRAKTVASLGFILPALGIVKELVGSTSCRSPSQLICFM